MALPAALKDMDMGNQEVVRGREDLEADMVTVQAMQTRNRILAATTLGA